MKKPDNKKDTPSTTLQIAKAMQALGLYDGENTEAEHRAEVDRLGSDTYYHALMVNALLGGVEAEALHTDSSRLEFEQMMAAHEQAVTTSGAGDSPDKLMKFLRWRALRVGGPLRQIAQNEEAGPIPVAAAHATEALQMMLSVCSDAQNLAQADPEKMVIDLKTARESLVYSLANLDIMFDLIKQIDNL